LDVNIQFYCIPQVWGGGPLRIQTEQSKAMRRQSIASSARSFMHWPTDWLWAAVIVAMALLIFVGLVMSESGPPSKDSTGSTPSSRVNT